jgi:hypothetical protein
MGKFVKGQSGNPGGLKQGKKLREAFLPLRPKAVQRVSEALDDPDPKIRMQASQIVFDRTDGKPLAASEVLLRDEREAAAAPQQQVLTPPEVLAALGEILTKCETEMGISPDTGLTNDQRVERMLRHGVPVPPDLYKAVMQLGETRH